MAAISVPIKQAYRFGIVTSYDDGKTTDFVVEPKLPKTTIVSMGTYVFKKPRLIDRLIEDANKKCMKGGKNARADP